MSACSSIEYACGRGLSEKRNPSMSSATTQAKRSQSASQTWLPVPRGGREAVDAEEDRRGVGPAVHAVEDPVAAMGEATPALAPLVERHAPTYAPTAAVLPPASPRAINASTCRAAFGICVPGPKTAFTPAFSRKP